MDRDRVWLGEVGGGKTGRWEKDKWVVVMWIG